jgi:hypothetical protein
MIIVVLVLALLLAACQKKDQAQDTSDACDQTLPLTLLVSAEQRWVNTQVNLEAGETVQITAEGEVSLEDGEGDESTPDGYDSCESAIWGKCSLEGAGWGILVGKVGGGSPFVIGSASQITAQESGCLQLGINDTYYDDNAGGYTVTIEATE